MSTIRTPIRAAICISAGALVLFSVACGSRQESTLSRETTLVIAYPYDGRLLGPSDDEAMYLVFLPLVRYDQNGNLEPRLARSWEHSPDYREWTYHLRTDVRWHDGVPVTAHDVKFTLDLLTHPAAMEMMDNSIHAVRVLDDSTVTIRSGAPEYYQTQVVHYPRHLLQNLDPEEMYDWRFWLEPVGNGPYRFVRYVPQTMMEFEANPDYVYGEPRIKRVVLKFVEGAGLNELLSGSVDVVKWLDDPGQVSRLAADPRFQAHYTFWGGRSRAIYWRCDHPILGDVRVRRALDLAVDRRELIRALNLPEGLTAGSGFYTERQLRRGTALRAATHDIQRARRLLDEAGWIDRDGDGFRDRNGTRLRFNALVNASERYDNAIAVYVQDQLREIGADMQLQPLDGGALFARYRAGNFEAAVFQVWLQERFAIEDTPLAYRNPRLAELLDTLRSVAEPAAVDRTYQQLTEIFRRDVPITFLFPIVHTHVAHSRLKGLNSPFHSEPVYYAEELWLDDSETGDRRSADGDALR